MNILVCLYSGHAKWPVSDEMVRMEKKVELFQENKFQNVLKKIREKTYELVVLFTFEQAFPIEWNLSNLNARCPSIVLSGVDLNIRSLVSLIDSFETTVRLQKSNDSFAESLRYIEDHLYDPELSLEKAASHIYVSRCYYSRIFQKNVGIGFKEYIIHKRIRKAMSLLEEGSAVTEVCYAVGYNDLTHFGRAFKRLVGVNPSGYKNNVDLGYERVLA
ncbi:helix-turn-helix domain-containing protein [Paenibacillus sp. SYP-B4298]|uniref:helix-turn-helix domain-containing protein n=1 Tax=Paenibacillus sp. SYP-B4298 TaxID=2996034 RepID=UPI0022DD50CB|nr:AraC family transcriptional regulator [Paenibacillus sp. SYP-B4298]